MDRPQGICLEHLPHLYVYPGQLYASATPCAVTTILGTCVSVCLWDPVARVGGLNHYLLPYPVLAQDASPRFGQVAIDQLFDRVLGLGAAISRLQAKVFGGMTCRFRAGGAGRDLGGSNVELAMKLLGERRVPVVASSVGGPHGRKLVFQLDDGTAWVRSVEGRP